MGPEFEPLVPLREVLLYAFLNPVVLGVAFVLGRKADERSKIMIGAFAGAVAGVACLYLLTLLRIGDAPTVGRAAAGVFVASLFSGLIASAAGYYFRRK